MMAICLIHHTFQGVLWQLLLTLSHPFPYLLNLALNVYRKILAISEESRSPLPHGACNDGWRPIARQKPSQDAAISAYFLMWPTEAIERHAFPKHHSSCLKPFCLKPF